MEAYLGEVLGTFLLMVLGLGVNANVSLKKTYGTGLVGLLFFGAGE